MNHPIRIAFFELTQDVTDLKTKPWLATAIISHLTRWCPDATRDDIAKFVNNYFAN